MVNTYSLISALCLIAVACAPAHAERGEPARAVVELFTSQGCYSCPPADALLQETIKEHPDVVALEYHVDYWDELVYGAAGQWRDPYSDRAFSSRQRDYNGRALEGRRGVYTPQMIVNGVYGLVGSDRKTLARQLDASGKPKIEVFVQAGLDGWSIDLHGETPGDLDIYLVRFLPSVTTSVTAGENHGKHMRNNHVVTAIERLARWHGATVSLPRDKSANVPETGCAILAQRTSGAILGAAYCP